MIDGMSTTTETPAPATQGHVAWMASTIYAAVEPAPMIFIADGGDRAYKVAERIERRTKLRINDRAASILNELRGILEGGVHGATQELNRTMETNPHDPMGTVLQGRAQGWAAALTALKDAQASLAYGTTPETTTGAKQQ